MIPVPNTQCPIPNTQYPIPNTQNPTPYTLLPMTPSLYSVAIFVSDIDRAVAFYHETLGLPLRSRGSFGAELCEGDSRIGVHPAAHAEAKGMVGRHTGITLHVPDLLHHCGVLHDRGVRFVAEPTQQAWGIMAMVADPDGNVLALWEDKLPGDVENSGEGTP